MSSQKSFAVSALAVLALSSPVSSSLAQATTLLDATLVTGSKIPKQTVELTHSVTVVDEQDIAEGAYTDVTEVLRKQVGLEFKQTGGPGQFNYLKMRGLSARNVLVVIDGVKINKPSSGDTGSLLSQIDPDTIETIEILRGPQATLYGANNSAGVIVITTKSGHTPSAQIAAEVGSLSWRKLAGSVRNSAALGNGTLLYSLNASTTDSDNTHAYEFFEDTTLQGKLSFETDTLELGASVLDLDNRFGYAELDEAGPGVETRSQHWAYQTPDPDQNSTTTEQVYTLFGKQQLTDALSHKLQVSQAKNTYTVRDPDNGFLGVHIASVDNIISGSVKGDVLYIYDRFYNGAGGISLTPNPAGSPGDVHAEYRDRSDQYNYDVVYEHDAYNLIGGIEHLKQSATQQGTYGEADNDDAQTSYYLNGDVRLLDRTLVLALGARLDDYDSWGEHTTGNVGLSWQSTDQTSLYANVGTSFAPATLSQLFNPIYGDSSLTPEEGTTVEFGIRQSALNDRLTLEATYWNTQIDNVIYYDADLPNPRNWGGFGQYANGAEARSSGVELQATYQLTARVRVDGNYTYTDSHTKAVDGGWERTVQVARNKGNLGVSFRERALTFDLNAYYSGPRLRWAGDVEMKEYVRIDLASTYDIGQGLVLSTRIENLLNEDIEEGLGYEEPGLYAIVGATYHF